MFQEVFLRECVFSFTKKKNTIKKKFISDNFHHLQPNEISSIGFITVFPLQTSSQKKAFIDFPIQFTSNISREQPDRQSINDIIILNYKIKNTYTHTFIHRTCISLDPSRKQKKNSYNYLNINNTQYLLIIFNVTAPCPVVR